MPTLIGLMVAVGVLRASGFLDFVSVCLKKLLAFINLPADLFPIAIVKLFHIPQELVPITLVRLVSNSAATGLLLDLYKEHGCDSFAGMAASIMLSSTETIFYTMSIYFMSVKVKKTRYTLAGALIATIAGIIASVILATYM